MNILENEIEDLIFNSIQNNPQALSERGFYTYTLISNNLFLRQVDLGSYGRLDLLGVYITGTRLNKYYYRHIVFTIYEIKKDEINNSTFLQSLRYFKGIQQLLRKSNINIKNCRISYNFCLIGKRVSKTCDFVYLPDVFNNVILQTFDIDLECGLRFNTKYGFTLEKGTVGCFTKNNLSQLKEYFKNRVLEELYPVQDEFQDA